MVLQIGRYEIGGIYDIYDMVQKDILAFQRFSDEEAIDNLVKRINVGNLNNVSNLVHILRERNRISALTSFNVPVVLALPSSQQITIKDERGKQPLNVNENDSRITVSTTSNSEPFNTSVS